MSHTHPIEDVVVLAEEIVAGKARGRTVREIG